MVTLIGAGITLHEALKAADALPRRGVAARVIDLYSVKPIDAETVLKAARETGAIVTVEDHWPEGGIGDAVLDVLAAEQPHPIVAKLAVRGMPTSGTPAELMAAAGIDAEPHRRRRQRALVSGAPGASAPRPRSAAAGASNGGDPMSGAEADRRQDKAVDQDGESERARQQAAGQERNALHRLWELGQSPWIDFIDRDLIASGKLSDLVDEGIRGLTSNPTIFAKAVASGQYDDLVRREIESGDDARTIYEEIAVGGRRRRRRRAAQGVRRGRWRRRLREHRGRAGPRRGHGTARSRAPGSCGHASSGRTSSSRSPRPRRAFPRSRPPSARAST